MKTKETKTNEQIYAYIQRALRKYGARTEPYYSALYRFWIKYPLTDEQNQMLEQAKYLID